MTRKELVRINLWLGKYRILSVLNSSSVQSTVFLAEQVRLQEKCIIKKIRKDHPFFFTLQKEVFFLRHLKSNFIPQLYDVEEDEENLYIIEEFIEGYTLEENLTREKISERDLFNLIIQLSDFVIFLQERERPILYLDWKPENIMVSEGKIKIIDLGSAIFEDEKENLPILATEGYSAPELSRGGEVGTFTDIYGLGCIFKSLALFLVDKRGVFKKSRRGEFLKLVEKCTKPNPVDRWEIRKIQNKLVRLEKKSILLKDYEYFSISDRKARTLGVTGLFHGVGTSHIATLIAMELLKFGGEVAYIDYGKKQKDKGHLLKLSKFSKKLKVIEVTNKSDMIKILNSKYDYVVIDFGLLDIGDLDEILRCDKKMIVMQYSELRLSSQMLLLEKIKKAFRKENTELIVNLSEGGEKNQVRKEVEKLDIRWDLKEQGFKKIKL